MAVREVVDRYQRRWTIWRVIPSFVERRRELHPEIVRRVGERRRWPEWRATVRPGHENGWLTFETPGERRRLVPFPEHWSDLMDEQLLELLDRAETMPARGRLP